MASGSILQYFERFERQGRDVACIYPRGYRIVCWRYRELARAAHQFARELERRGIGKGERILLWGHNCGEWVAVFWGCMLRGVVVVPVDVISSPEFAASLYQETQARLAVVSRDRMPYTGGWTVMVLEDLAAVLAGHESSAYHAAPNAREDPVEIVFTSGATARPKGVVITHSNLLTNLEPLDREIKKYLKYERPFHPIRFLNLLPLSHVFGQFMGIFVPPLVAGAVVFQDSLNPAAVITAIRRERVSVLMAVPRLLQSLMQKIERDREAEGTLVEFHKQLESDEKRHFLRRWWSFRRIHRQFGWKFWACISGGAALDATTEAFWRRLGYVVIQGYGLTETTSLVAVNHPFHTSHGSIGKVLPGREVKLGEQGEILVRGGSVAPYYWQDRQLQPVSKEAWFDTGDIAELDSAGNLYFKGRKKNVIVTPEGLKVYPEDLEAVLRKQPEVRDCVVYGRAVDGNAEAFAALLLHERSMDAATLMQRVNQELAAYQAIRHWYVWPEEDFPRTPTFKPQIHAIERFIAEQAGQRAASSPSGGVAELVAQTTRRNAGGISAQPNPEADLQLSSIERVELQCALEDRYQVELNDAVFNEVRTVAELERMLHQPMAAKTEYRYPRWAQRAPVRWLRCALYYLLAWPATRIMSWPKIVGRETLKVVAGPLLIICNHITMADVGFIMAALPFSLRHHLAVAMQGEQLMAMRHPPASLHWFARLLEKTKYVLVVTLFNVFPLPQKSGLLESFGFAGECADRGASVLVFPEGERTSDGALHEFRSGIGMLANNLSLPVLPMSIDGLYELKQKRQWFARSGTVTVSIGEPIRFQSNADPAEVARELRQRVAGMLAVVPADTVL